MKRLLLFCFSFILAFGLQAQSESKVIDVKLGEAPTDTISENSKYAFNEFTEGRVIYKNGTAATSKLNYNYLLGAMEFIEPTQDNEIFALANTTDILMVIIDNREFLPIGNRHEFAEVLVVGNYVYLAVNRKVKSYLLGTEGAYGIVSTTASTSSVSRITERSSGGKLGSNGTENLTIKQYHRVNLENSYYLYSNGKSNYIKNEKVYTKVFPESKAHAIEKYVADNKINFSKEEDLIKLTEYCNNL